MHFIFIKRCVIKHTKFLLNIIEKSIAVFANKLLYIKKLKLRF